MSAATEIVSVLLDNDAHDEHMKGWKRIQHWDGALSTYKDLAVKKVEAHKLFLQLGQGLALERGLAQNGVTKQDVAGYIYGGSISASHNYKRLIPAKACQNAACSQFNMRTVNPGQTCQKCDQPLGTIMRQILPRELQTKYAKHILGVKLNDDRTVWFKDPVPPRDYQPADMEVTPS